MTSMIIAFLSGGGKGAGTLTHIFKRCQKKEGGDEETDMIGPASV